MKILSRIEAVAKSDKAKLIDCIGVFENLASQLFPNGENRNAISNLQKTLNTPVFLNSFVPASDNEVQLMTLHKAKGLEFDIVLHLNMSKWILPQYKGDYYQDLNLHYVGITRARKCCILCSTTFRHSNDEVKAAEESEFLYLNGLESWRLPCPI